MKIAELADKKNALASAKYHQAGLRSHESRAVANRQVREATEEYDAAIATYRAQAGTLLLGAVMRLGDLRESGRPIIDAATGETIAWRHFEGGPAHYGDLVISGARPTTDLASVRVEFAAANGGSVTAVLPSDRIEALGYILPL